MRMLLIMFFSSSIFSQSRERGYDPYSDDGNAGEVFIWMWFVVCCLCVLGILGDKEDKKFDRVWGWPTPYPVKLLILFIT